MLYCTQCVCSPPQNHMNACSVGCPCSLVGSLSSFSGVYLVVLILVLVLMTDLVLFGCSFSENPLWLSWCTACVWFSLMDVR